MQDVENAYFTLMWQLVQKLKPLVVMLEGSYKTLQRCAEARDEIIENELQLPKRQGKQILLEIVNGGGPPEELANKEVLIDLQQVSLWLKWLAMTNLPELYDHCEKAKSSPENSIVASLYQSIEDLVLTSWIGYLSTLDLTHLSLHFDGVRVEGRRSINIEEICRHSEDWIGKETGFSVNIKEKKHMLFQELLAHRGEVSSVVELDPIFKESRNCIFACLAYLTGKQVAIEEWLSKQHEDDESGAPKWRSYKACFLAARSSGVPVVGCEARQTGKYILHCEHDGLPLAIGCVTEADSCKVFFATGVVLTMSAKTLHDCADECVDASSLVTFSRRTSVYWSCKLDVDLKKMRWAGQRRVYVSAKRRWKDPMMRGLLGQTALKLRSELGTLCWCFLHKREARPSNKKTASVMAHPSDAPFALSESSAEDAVSWNMFVNITRRSANSAAAVKNSFGWCRLFSMMTNSRAWRRNRVICGEVRLYCATASAAWTTQWTIWTVLCDLSSQRKVQCTNPSALWQQRVLPIDEPGTYSILMALRTTFSKRC